MQSWIELVVWENSISIRCTQKSLFVLWCQFLSIRCEIANSMVENADQIFRWHEIKLPNFPCQCTPFYAWKEKYLFNKPTMRTCWWKAWKSDWIFASFSVIHLTTGHFSWHSFCFTVHSNINSKLDGANFVLVIIVCKTFLLLSRVRVFWFRSIGICFASLSQCISMRKRTELIKTHTNSMR